MDQGLHAAFLKIKPVCNSITTKPTKENLIELKELVSTLPAHPVQLLHDFILYPLGMSLLNTEIRKNSNLKLILLDTLKCLLEIIHLEKIKTFTRLYMSLMLHIYDPNSPTMVANIDEETKLGVIRCLELLFKNLQMDLRYDLYTKEESLQLCQCCLVCLRIAKDEKLRILRITAIECIMAMAYVYDEADFADKELRHNVADVMMSFLPGILLGLIKVATGDVKQGHKITALSIKAIHRIIVLQMQDDECPREEKIIFQYPPKMNELDKIETENKAKKTLEDLVNKFNNESRTREWFKETASKLKPVINILVPLQYHEHPAVRLQMTELCEGILMHCCCNMNSSVGPLIEILIALSEDDDENISKKSRGPLNNVLEKSFKTLNISPIEIVEENFYNVLTTIPRIMNEIELTKKLNALNLLVGYLRLIGPNHLYEILQSSSHLKRLVLTLLHVSQLERSNISLFEEHAIRDFEVISDTPITWKQFTYISEKELLNKFQTVLQLLSESNAVDMLIDHLCDIFANATDNKNETIFLINELLAVRVKDIDNKMYSVDRVFNMYLEESNWYLPLSVNNADEDDVSTVPLFNVHNNIIQICLLVEGIGNMAKGIGENFKHFLLKALYVVLERAGSAQPLISAAGFLTLTNISKCCGYQSVTNLIIDNTDYFSFHVIQRLKKIERNPQVLDVLNVVMNYSTKDVLPPIMDIISKVLLQSCDKFQQHNATSFLRVFLSFVQNLQRWLRIDTKPDNRHITLLMSYKKIMDQYYTLYSGYEDENFDSEAFKVNVDNLSEEDFKTPVEETEDDSYKKPEPPEHIKLTVDILKRSLNFLPSKDRQRKLLVLDILKHGVKIISKWEDELLPIVHLIWSPLTGRFKEFSDPLIVNRSFELLSVLATTSKDFIRLRTSKDIFPNICTNLQQLSEQSYLKDRGSAYRYTQAYKLQINLLKNLSQLIEDLEMVIKDVYLAMENVLPYLSNKQPLPLQELAISFYKTLAYYDFDSVWLFLINEYGVKRIREELIVKKDNEKNVESVLKILNLAKW